MSAIVSVHSFRGGTGKSNTTANIATLLAAEGRRVGVIDTTSNPRAFTSCLVWTRSRWVTR